MKSSHTFSNFTEGMDRRYIENDKNPNGFYNLVNCSINAENEIETRPGMELQCSLDSSTEGLFPFDGKLWTVFRKRTTGSGAATPPSTLLPQPADGTELWQLDLQHNHSDITEILYSGVYLGGIYLAVETNVKLDATKLPGVLRNWHYYIAPVENVWESEYDFDGLNPGGTRILPTNTVDDVNRIIRMGAYFEALPITRGQSGSVEPTWTGSVVYDNNLQWTRVPLNVRAATTAPTYTNNAVNDIGGVYMVTNTKATDGKKEWVAFWATNIEPGESKSGSEDTPLSDFDTAKIGDFINDGEIVWKAVSARNWAADRWYDISYPVDRDDMFANDFALCFESPVDSVTDIWVGEFRWVRTGVSEPNWSSKLAHGSRFQDGDVTWVRKNTRILDPACPNSPEVIVHQSKVYALGSHLKYDVSFANQDDMRAADQVKFCATGDPFDWHTEEDAGFLPVGVQATGSDVAKALGKFDDGLVVLFEDHMQHWAVDPDPQRNALKQIIGDIGTTFSRTVVNVGTDLVFLSPSGFRSVGQQINTVNLQDTDVGTPVDRPVSAEVKFYPADKPFAELNSERSQYWCCLGNKIWVWTWSRNSKVKAWSYYTLYFYPRYFANLNNKFYVRAYSNVVTKANPDIGADYLGPIPVSIDWSFQSMGGIGKWKQFQGVDMLSEGGSPSLSFSYNANDWSDRSPAVEMPENTRSRQLTPVEILSTEIAPRITYNGNTKLRIRALTLYYTQLGVL